MKLPKYNSGFSAVEALMVVAILAVIGFIGYNIAMNTIYKDQLTGTINTVIKQQSKTATDVPDAQSINTTADIKTTEAMLDSINLDEVDTDIKQIDSQLSNF